MDESSGLLQERAGGLSALDKARISGDNLAHAK
jgi:hypothetical protein